MLLTPVVINKTEFRNRIIFPPMLSRFAGSGGEMTDQLIHYHAARARGGVGLNMLEATCVHPTGMCFDCGLNIFDDRYIKGFRKFTDAIHKEGGKCGVQLNHGGLHSLASVSGHPVPLVSFVPGMTPEENSRVLDEEEILELIEAWGQAARRAVEAGFDIVEIHGAHGYLIGQFLSPLTNTRTDAWGGDLERRMRFALEVVRSVRKAVGPDFPVSFRCSVEELLPGGLELEEGCLIAKAICEAGVDLFNVSSATCTNTWFIEAGAALPAVFNGDRVREIRKSVGAGPKLAVAARIGTREDADSILGADGSDMVCMGGALICDPDLPNKLAAGRDDAVRPCIYCREGCCGQPLMSCALNPHVGQERYGMPSAKEKKSVGVVGGGPAGMEFARAAAIAGHTVTLYEAEGSLSGKLFPASVPPKKSLIAKASAWWARQLAELGVTIKTGVKADAAMLKAAGHDVIFVATGSKPVCPGFLKGNPRVKDAEAVLRGESVGQRLLVLGGGLVGCETAAFLGEAGADVTIVELREALAIELRKHSRVHLLAEIEKLGTNVLLNHSLVSVSEDGVAAVKDRWGNIFELPAFDTVIVAVGYASSQELCAELAREGVPFITAGDCEKPAKILDAVHGAYKAALTI